MDDEAPDLLLSVVVVVVVVVVVAAAAAAAAAAGCVSERAEDEAPDMPVVAERATTLRGCS